MRIRSILTVLLLALAVTTVDAQTVTTVSGPTIALGWTADTLNTKGVALTGTTTYNLYQGACTSGATLSKVQTGIVGTSAVVSAGILPGTTYGFELTAVNGGIEATPTAMICVQVAVAAPATPANFHAIASG